MKLQKSRYTLIETQWKPDVRLLHIYRTMQYNAKHSLAIACRISVRLFVTLVDCDHIGWNMCVCVLLLFDFSVFISFVAFSFITFVPVGWVFWPVKTVSHITHTVLAGT